MAVTNFESPYGLVFNLDKYTGGMEREFCAYILGKTGQCDVGSEMAARYDEDHPKDTKYWALGDRCSAEQDDHGTYRPVSIFHDRNIDVESYQSLIIFLDTRFTGDEMEMLLARAKRFCAERPDLEWMGERGKGHPLTLKGAYLLSNKVERVQRVEKTFDIS